MQLMLSRVGYWVPEDREPIEAVLNQADRPPHELRLLRGFLGLAEVPVVPRGYRIEEMLARAAHDLNRKEDLSEVGLVLYAHTGLACVPEGYDIAGRLTQRLGLAGCPFLGVSHVNCTAAFYAVRLAQQYLSTVPSRTVQVLTLVGDLAHFMPEGRHVPGSTVMGEAAVAFAVGTNRRTGYRLLSLRTRHDTRFWEAMYMSRQTRQAFNRHYLQALADTAHDALRDAGLTWNQIDHVVPQNVNVATWSRFAEMTSIELHRIFTRTVAGLGHLYSADAFLNLALADEEGVIMPGERALLLGIGLGAYFAAAVIEKLAG